MVDRVKRVLVVDDEEVLLNVIGAVLEDEGYSVKTASDGLEALALVTEHRPDLILLDMKMPRMDGWEFARTLRARNDGDVPIIVLSAADSAKKRADEIGAAGWLSKPFDLDDLIHKVGLLVERNQPG